MSLSLAIIEHQLRARRLDHTLTSSALWALRRPEAVVSSGIPPLDDWLGGGYPKGQVSEIVGPRSSGRTGLAWTLLASATGRGDLVALVDTLDSFDPQTACCAGVGLSRMLWVRGTALGEPSQPLDGAGRAWDMVSSRARRQARAVRDGMGWALDRAIKALNAVLQAGGFAVVVLDVADVPPPTLARLPLTTWRRLHRVIEGSEVAVVVVTREPVARSVGGLSLMLDPATTRRWTGQSLQARLLAGARLRLQLSRAVSHRGHAPELELAARVLHVS